MYFRRTDCLDFARMEDVQCLLDFSNGPNAMVLKTVKVDPTSNLVLPETEDKRVYADLDGSPPSFAAMTEPGSSKIMCTYCGKSFGHRGDYNKHLRRHTGERPYSCTKCPQTFSLSSNLKRHEKLHSGETPFKCHRCEKMFSRKDKLTAHEKRKRCGDELNKSPAR